MRTSSLHFRLVLTMLCLGLWGLGGCTHMGGAAASPSKAPLLINVTHGRDNLHAASMALRMASTALEQGHRVVVLLNVNAPILGSTQLGEDVRHSDFPPITQMVRDVISRGGQVIVCGHCATEQGVQADSLLSGVTVGNGAELLKHTEQGMIGLSY